MTTQDRRAPTWTIKELIDWAAEDFKKRDIDSPRLDAEILLAHALACKRVDLYIRFDQCPAQEDLDRFKQLLKRRRDRESVDHIIGQKPFHEIDVTIPPGLFAPRPETELLVDEAVMRLREVIPGQAPAADICSGSGCIALAMAKAVPGLSVIAVDIDPRAGKATTDNAQRLGLQSQIEFRLGDFIEPIAQSGPFSLIACNPPYIPTLDIDGLMPEVRDHEPRIALDGGQDGLDFVRRLIDAAPGLLAPAGWLLIEIGEGQDQKVKNMQRPGLACEKVRKDLAGIPRIAIFRKG